MGKSTRLPDSLEATPFGFKWGLVEVSRDAFVGGYRFLSVHTGHGLPIDIEISPTGRKITVTRGGKELKAE